MSGEGGSVTWEGDSDNDWGDLKEKFRNYKVHVYVHICIYNNERCTCIYIASVPGLPLTCAF